VAPSILARDGEGRQAKGAGRGGEVGVTDRRAGRSVAGGGRAQEHVAPERKRRILGAEARREPALEDRVGDRRDAARLDGGDAVLPDRGGADPGGGVAEDQRTDAAGAAGGEGLSNHPADREAADDGRLDAEGVQQRLKVG
jgi:hypothetical protein